MYAPEQVQVVSSQQAPVLDIAKIGNFQYRIGVNGSSGQTIILLTSSNLFSWQPLVTNVMASSRWMYTNNPGLGTQRLYYRAAVSN
jgi:hypothetical protein